MSVGIVFEINSLEEMCDLMCGECSTEAVKAGVRECDTETTKAIKERENRKWKF